MDENNLIELFRWYDENREYFNEIGADYDRIRKEAYEQFDFLNLPIVRVCAWEGATAAQQEPFIDKAAELVQDTLFCSRVWSAWGYGTMTADDFSDAVDDEDFIEAIAKAIWEGH
jgi:hypothetical protein